MLLSNKTVKRNQKERKKRKEGRKERREGEKGKGEGKEKGKGKGKKLPWGLKSLLEESENERDTWLAHLAKRAALHFWVMSLSPM